MAAPPLQDARADLVRERVLDGVARVLGDGEDLTFARVARAAGVPERTVYRHFPNRDALMAAVFEWANDQVGFTGAAPSTPDAMTAMVRQVFPGFDAIGPVVDELLSTTEGRRARLVELDERRAAAEAVVAHEAPNLGPAQRRQVAAVIQVLGTAAVWQALRDFWDWDGETSAAAVATTIELLLAGAAAQKQPSRNKKGRT